MGVCIKMIPQIYFNVERQDGSCLVADVWTLDELQKMDGVKSFPEMVGQIKKSVSELYPNCSVWADSRPCNK